MRVDHVLEWGPGKDGEASILGCERERVTLILDELRGREMSGATELGRMHDRGRAPFDRFRNHDFLDSCPTVRLDVGRGVAIGDLDNDGAVDVVVTNKDGDVRLLHNENRARQHWLQVRLEGVKSATASG